RRHVSPGEGHAARGRLGLPRPATGRNPSRKERWIAAPAPSTFGAARQRQLAIRANGGEGFERHGRGGRAPRGPVPAPLGTLTGTAETSDAKGDRSRPFLGIAGLAYTSPPAPALS